MAIVKHPLLAKITGTSDPIDSSVTLRAIQKKKCENSLANFIRYAWPIIEPGQPYIHNWHVDFICLPAHVILETRYGPMAIGDIVESGWAGEVLSFNHSLGKPEWKKILARMKNPGKPLYTLKVNHASVSMTGNHPVFIDGRGYVPADQLRVGDRVIQLQAVREGLSEKSSEDCGGHILRQGMFCSGKIRTRKTNMQHVWRPKIAWGWERLHKVSPSKNNEGKIRPLSKLWKSCLAQAISAERFLRSQMFWGMEKGGTKPSLCGWEGSGSISYGIQGGEKENTRPRGWNLFRLLGGKETGRSSYRQRGNQQRTMELGGFVSDMSSSARVQEIERLCYKTVESHVSSIEREIRIPDTVYNIEVEGNNNYFADNLLVHNCAHLESITAGAVLEDGTPYNRLLINIPPGTMKSLLVNCFWPSWEWGPKNMPHLRYVCAAHEQNLAVRDGLRMRRLIQSEWYQSFWGDRVTLTGDNNQKIKFENTATGFRQSIAAGGITGARGDRVLIDDPISVEGASSDAVRASTNEWFTEAVPLRLNNPKTSAIVVIMQRLHEEDVSGIILEKDLGYDHICLPMRFDPSRAHETQLGYSDPREEEGELLFPERFPPEVVDRDEKAMGPFATAGQHQQSPEPRGGGIIKRDWWIKWDDDVYPPLDFVCASLDTAYTEKTENDMSALTVWGVFSQDIVAQPTRTVSRAGTLYDYSMEHGRKYAEQHPKVVLTTAWAERLELHALVTKVAKTCKDMKVDLLLIEGKASGISVAQEIQRLYNRESWGVQLINPGAMDKIARLYSVQHLFSEGMIYAPDRSWADMVITQCAQFPKAKHDDLVDSASMALSHLRKTGMLVRSAEHLENINERMQHKPNPPPLYDV